MRDIKFRAWDKEHQEMCEVDSLINDKVFILDGAYILDKHHDIHLMKNIELMQYTGLKDKNRTEIYEGDLVKATYIRDKSIILCEISKIEYEYVIIDISTGEILKFDEIYRRSLEVIGNIYENPEPLEGISDEY